ncbi:MAG: D-glycero-beta-D-manno-heptose 1-phosphate adenylyltransferase [Candidatus Omnitrophota bacterium]|nr:D-glycero-beta-D-manno-heptose 1-phosphate adenylyltransferase [Candidatus Omnitrophota bacterium]
MLKDKIKSLRSLRRIVFGLQKKGKKIIFTNGCFDILHLGHAQYLEGAKALGDVLVVGVNSDNSVKRIKGKSRPIVGQKERISLIAALESVDYTVLFNEDTPARLIQALRPDVLVKGADWKKNDIVGASFVKSNGGKVATVRLVNGLSTSNIIKKIQHRL